MSAAIDLPESYDGHVDPATSLLTPYRGQPVMAAGVAIPNAAGGLHDALKVDPIELDLGDTVYVVLKCEVRPPSYDPIDKDNYRGPLKLVNRLHAVEGTFVDGDLVKEHLAQQRQRIEQAESIEEQRRREEAGEMPLPFGDDGEPVTVGSVLDESIDALQDAEDDETWRAGRREELATWSKDALRTELTDVYGAEVPSRATVNELVELVLDHEADNR